MNILDKHSWQTLDGKSVDDVREHINRYSGPRFTIHVGTDTKPTARDVTMISTICFREESKGAVVIYQKSKINVFPTVRDRLFHETFVSLELAAALMDLTGIKPTIHADVNPKKEALSNRTLDAIIGMIKGMGYRVLVKPDAWAADIADMYTR